jgi:protein-L-isoaspartate(D-aspartate) O-methyltransferase
VLLTDRQAETFRARLVRDLEAAGIRDERVLAAVRAVPRHLFVPDDSVRRRAYEDVALPIGLGQTISQPRTVARMTELLGVREGERVLEVGTGSGYQAAILVELGARVFSIERHEPILRRTAALLDDLGYRVRTRAGDGTLGWPAFAPFDAIVVTAGGPEVPSALVAQLRPPAPDRADARLLIPVGPSNRQRLHRITKTGEGTTETETFDGVVFVPLVRDE